jgi:thioesterase domain-containing protein
MTPRELEEYLHAHIPLSRAMEVRVVTADVDAVELQAPLAPNINHRATVFGGSASAVAILAAWSLLHLRLVAAQSDARLVIQRNTMDYLAPITGSFTATASLAAQSDWAAFLRLLARRGRARIGVGAVVGFDGRDAGRFHGEFVALGQSA